MLNLLEIAELGGHQGQQNGTLRYLVRSNAMIELQSLDNEQFWSLEDHGATENSEAPRIRHEQCSCCRGRITL